MPSEPRGSHPPVFSTSQQGSAPGPGLAARRAGVAFHRAGVKVGRNGGLARNALSMPTRGMPKPLVDPLAPLAGGSAEPKPNEPLSSRESNEPKPSRKLVPNPRAPRSRTNPSRSEVAQTRGALDSQGTPRGVEPSRTQVLPISGKNGR